MGASQPAEAIPDTQVDVRRHLDQHGKAIGALERGQRSTHTEIRRLHEKSDRIQQGVSDLGADYAKAVEHIVSVDNKLDATTRTNHSIFQELMKISKRLDGQQKTCDERHGEIDRKFDSIIEEDGYEDLPDTGVFETMTGIEVKNLLAEEKKEREKLLSEERAARETLQAQVEEMRQRDAIHQAQKQAVEQAKSKWEDELRKAAQQEQKASEREQVAIVETGKLKTARYTMYATIVVAVIGAVVSIYKAAVESDESSLHRPRTHQPALGGSNEKK